MRVLLFDTLRREYVEAPHSWTLDPARALDLEGTAQAVSMALEHGMTAFEIVLAFDHPTVADMRLPLTVPGRSTRANRSEAD